MRHRLPAIPLPAIPFALALLAAPTLITVAAPLHAQTAPAATAPGLDRNAVLEVRKQFLGDLDTLQAKFVALATAIPEDKYGWRPGAGVRSVGEAFKHVASEYYVFVPLAYGLTPSPVVQRGKAGFEAFEAAASKAEALKHLDEGFAFMRKGIAESDVTALSGTPKLFGGPRTIAETTLVMSADLHEHLGQLIAYARMIGVKPPWSK